jgi:hypothetical protein
MRRCTVVRRLFVGWAILICAMSIALAASGDWRKEQTIWWNDAQLVKSAVVGYLKLLNSNPDLMSKDNPLWQIDSLVLILDARNDRTTLNVLASLSSYNLGASGSEVYQCVLRRKGSKILPLLQASLEAGKNECTETIARDATVCRTPAEHATWLKDNIAAIKADRSCALDQ